VALLFIIGLLFLAAAAGLLTRAITLTRVRTASQLRQIDAYGFNATEAPGAHVSHPLPATRRLSDLAERIGASVKGTGWRAPVTTPQLRGAGLYTITPEMFQGYRVMLTGTLSSLILFDTVLAGSFSILTLPLIIATMALTWLGPAALVSTRAQRRMDRVDRDLPELIDLLIATIEAGLGFAGSLQLVADRFHGPLGQELRLTLGEQNMGLSTERALANLLQRCETPSVRAFVRAVSQAESLGVSIGTVMRNLAAETRKRRREAAREKVQKAPVKMLFPLVFMVFPALLIVLLYPAFHQLLQQLGGR
jgi:Flp pilus assembly protein TadB